MFRLIQKILLDDSRNGDMPWHPLLDRSARSHLEEHPVKYVKVDMYNYEMNQPLWDALPGWLRGEDESHSAHHQGTTRAISTRYETDHVQRNSG